MLIELESWQGIFPEALVVDILLRWALPPRASLARRAHCPYAGVQTLSDMQGVALAPSDIDSHLADDSTFAFPGFAEKLPMLLSHAPQHPCTAQGSNRSQQVPKTLLASEICQPAAQSAQHTDKPSALQGRFVQFPHHQHVEQPRPSTAPLPTHNSIGHSSAIAGTRLGQGLVPSVRQGRPHSAATTLTRGHEDHCILQQGAAGSSSGQLPLPATSPPSQQQRRRRTARKGLQVSRGTWEPNSGTLTRGLAADVDIPWTTLQLTRGAIELDAGARWPGAQEAARKLGWVCADGDIPRMQELRCEPQGALVAAGIATSQPWRAMGTSLVNGKSSVSEWAEETWGSSRGKKETRQKMQDDARASLQGSDHASISGEASTQPSLGQLTEHSSVPLCLGAAISASRSVQQLRAHEKGSHGLVGLPSAGTSERRGNAFQQRDLEEQGGVRKIVETGLVQNAGDHGLLGNAVEERNLEGQGDLRTIAAAEQLQVAGRQQDHLENTGREGLWQQVGEQGHLECIEEHNRDAGKSVQVRGVHSQRCAHGASTGQDGRAGKQILPCDMQGAASNAHIQRLAESSLKCGRMGVRGSHRHRQRTAELQDAIWSGYKGRRSMEVARAHRPATAHQLRPRAFAPVESCGTDAESKRASRGGTTAEGGVGLSAWLQSVAAHISTARCMPLGTLLEVMKELREGHASHCAALARRRKLPCCLAAAVQRSYEVRSGPVKTSGVSAERVAALLVSLQMHAVTVPRVRAFAEELAAGDVAASAFFGLTIHKEGQVPPSRPVTTPDGPLCFLGTVPRHECTWGSASNPHQRVWPGAVPPACAVHPCMRQVADRLLDAPGTRTLLGIVASGGFAEPLVASGALGVFVTPGKAAPLDLLLLEAAKRLCISEPPMLFVCHGSAPEVFYFLLPRGSCDSSGNCTWQRNAAIVVSTGAVTVYSPWELQAAMATALGAHVAPGSHTAGAVEAASDSGLPFHMHTCNSLERVPLATIATAASLAALAPTVLQSILPAEARAAWSQQALQLLVEARHLLQLSGDRCAMLVAQDERIVAAMIAKAACGTGGVLAEISLGALQESAAAWTLATAALHSQLMHEGRNEAVAALNDGPAVLRIRELQRWVRSGQYSEIIGSAAAENDCNEAEVVETFNSTQ
jgi:hypothetical protein